MHDDITRQLLLHNKTLMWPRGYNALPPERLQASPSDHMAMPGTPGPRTGRIRPNSVRLTADIGTRSTRTGRIRPQDSIQHLANFSGLGDLEGEGQCSVSATSSQPGRRKRGFGAQWTKQWTFDISRVESFAFLFSQFNSGCQIVLTLKKKPRRDVILLRQRIWPEDYLDLLYYEGSYPV